MRLSGRTFLFLGDVYMSFAENFRNARKKAGLTQRQVADRLGLDRSAIAHYERGMSMPNLKNLAKICEILNVGTDELI